VWTFYATIVWSIGYWIVYPAWPTMTGYTKGVWGYSQRAVVAKQSEDARAAQATMRQKVQATPLAEIRSGKDPELLRFAMGAGNAAFQTNCAPCHGRGGAGFVGYPNLNDDDWIWGGSIEDIHKTILYGVRSGHAQTRTGPQMPRYGIDNMLDDKQIDAVAEYVLSLSGKATDPAGVTAGAKVFAENCVECHGKDGRGKPEQGAPNLADTIWLFGGTKQAVVESVRTGRAGQMPWWVGRLDEVTLKSLAVYVHSLGVGK
jgi:cytochrome c oxidase cbb3-type subunit 3